MILDVIYYDENVWRVQLFDMGRNILTWNELIETLFIGPNSRATFNDILASCPFEAFYLETVPLSEINTPFEMTCIRADKRDFSPLQRYMFEVVAMHKGEAPTAFVFPSKTSSGTETNTILIVPSDIGGKTSTCLHIAKFVREATREQQEAFWYTVTQELGKRSLQEEPTFVSTEGTGVHWLHLRLSRKPQHYKFYY